MKINKKYEPQNKMRRPDKKQPDFLFPVVFPSYRKISGKTLSQYLNQAIEWNIRAKKLDKKIIPCFVRNVDTVGDFAILKNKEQLPFAAKLQRLSTHREKTYKKSLPLFSQIFFQNYFENIHEFLLTDKENQPLLKLFSEKRLWKNKEELVYWDVSTQTIVEKDAIEWRKEKQPQLEVRCFVETKNDIFPLVVEDPMLLFSDVGIVVHSNDKRYKKHIGKKIIIPVINKSIPIFGATDIDTIKNNGIQRLNPLMDQRTLEKVKELGLPIDENYIDDYGCFGEMVENFGGKSVFEFTDNVIETLGTIGNLISQEEVIQDVPYSKATGQRLIKKVVSMTVLDFSPLSEEFSNRLETNFPDHADLNIEDPEILLETKNLYTQKLSLLEDSEGNFELFDLKSFSKYSLLSLLLLDQLRKGHIKPLFSIDEFIDLILLLPEEERLDLENQLDEGTKIRSFKNSVVSKNSEKFIEEFLGELEKLERLEEKEGGVFQFNSEKLRSKKKLHTIACADTFLQALALLQISTSQFVFHADEMASQTIINFFLFLFLLGGTECSVFPHEEHDGENIVFPEKFPKLAEKYGRESLKLFLSQQEKYDERKIEETLGYLKHLWNLFKILYEGGAYPKNLETMDKIQADGMGMYILGKRKDIKTKLEASRFKTKEYSEGINLLKKFTREEFAWYFVLVKRENGPKDKFLIAGQIYMDILIQLNVIIPEFIFMVENISLKPIQASLIDKIFSEEKDYKAGILFDIFKGIYVKKEELGLKKHMPINFYIQANPNMIDLIESHEFSLKKLFNIREIYYFGTNEVCPSGYKTFSILDMNLGVEAYDIDKKESSFEERERELRSKQQTSDYLRSLLISLSANPLTPAEKIKEKQQELSEIVAEIQQLEIKIKKAKMEKKGT